MEFEINISSRAPATLAAQTTIAIFVRQKPAALPTWIKQLPDPLAEAIKARWSGSQFEGKTDQAEAVYAADGSSAILVGLGKSSRLDHEAVRSAYGTLINKVRSERLNSVAAPFLGKGDARTAEAATVGALLANYQFAEFRSDTSKLTPQADALIIWESNASKRRAAKKGVASGEILAEATARVRDLVNTPANELTPKNYAVLAARWCKEAGIKLQVLGLREIARTGMGAVLAVGGGSDNQPRFLIATYLGQKRQPKAVDVALVGKGVTFDSGGISIKPSANMWEMRGDMMGSAVVLASVCAAAKLKLPQNIIMLAPLVENMPSGTAYRPGDIVKTLSGQTVEIMSTDAEGRMILADALTYAQRFNPKVIVDCATLTGAVAVALGDVCCGVFTESDKLSRAFDKAAGECGEKAWRLPMYEDYDAKFTSPVADMRNGGGRYGGGSVAARILRKFTGDFPWVHLDIAGVDLQSEPHPYCPKGASGFGARLVLEFLRGW